MTAEVSATPWNKDTQLMVLNVKAKDLPVEESTGSNLVFLVDVSGSMHSSDKIDLVKESLLIGAKGFIVKPLDEDKVKQVLQSIVKR